MCVKRPSKARDRESDGKWDSEPTKWTCGGVARAIVILQAPCGSFNRLVERDTERNQRVMGRVTRPSQHRLYKKTNKSTKAQKHIDSHTLPQQYRQSHRARLLLVCLFRSFFLSLPFVPQNAIHASQTTRPPKGTPPTTNTNTNPKATSPSRRGIGGFTSEP